MKKAVAVIGAARLSIAQKIEHSRFIITSMTGNSNFPTPSPALSVITTNVNNLETASIAAKSGGKDETAVMRSKELVLDISIKSLCAYVEGIANNNLLTAEAVILSSGFDVRQPAAMRPNGFRVITGKNAGEITVQTDSESRAIFTFQMTLTPEEETSWQQVHSNTRARFTMIDLESGKRYFFRSCKTNKDGTEPWSNVLSAVAL